MRGAERLLQVEDRHCGVALEVIVGVGRICPPEGCKPTKEENGGELLE